MAKYLVIYRAPMSARSQMAGATPEQARAGMDAWMRWAKRAGGAILDLGSPLGDAVAIGAGPDGSGSFVGGYSIVQAETPEALKAVFADHPHLSMPGTSIEAYEFLPMPGM